MPIRRAPATGPHTIEPRRLKRLAQGRPRNCIDLHGLTQAEARASLVAFLKRCLHRGDRDALIITGKGILGDGILRRRVPEWLGEPPLRPFIAGISEAHRRHGGAGALYVALKRRV